MAIERLTPGTQEWEAYYANHIMRYQFAAEFLREYQPGKILDAACGTGFGSLYLSKEIPASIIAIDRSQEGLAIAMKKFSSAKIQYVNDDCHTLSASGLLGPYDAVVSFETLEHLPRPHDFLKSCHHVLKSQGHIIVSTPNQLVSSPGNKLDWEYHEKEYTAGEFYNIIKEAGFSNIRLFGQQLTPKGKLKSEIRSDLNRLWSNPMVRFGRWLQKTFRGRTFEPVLKETADDLEIVPFHNHHDSDSLGTHGPFVLIAVAEKINS